MQKDPFLRVGIQLSFPVWVRKYIVKQNRVQLIYRAGDLEKIHHF
jgi:hypothetical protein